MVGVNGDGFEIGGSWELNDQFHLFGSWQDQSFDGGFDGETLELGGGWSHSFSDTLDFVGTLSFLDAEDRGLHAVTTAWRSAAAFAAVSASRSSSTPA